jgi:hypothetical protein
MSDYALGLVAEETFIELDNDIKDRKWQNEHQLKN